MRIYGSNTCRKMKLVEVINKKDRQRFLEVPKTLYKNDNNWICPLDSEIEAIFDKNKNKKFETGAAKRWLLEDDSGASIGRIAAFYDQQMMTHFKHPTGGCGFFECVDNQEAANALFDVAKNWLQEKGMKGMQGPVNFGENYNHWGLLVKGFLPQSYALPYNFPYYQRMFESYGFQNYFEQYSYYKKVHGEWPERMIKFADYTSSRANYKFESFSYSRLDEFVDYFVDVYNQIWSSFHDNYTPMERGDIRQMLLDAKPVMDEELMWFAFDKGKPIGFIGVYPNINQLLAKLKNGKLNIINKLKFAYYKKRVITSARVFVGGVLPEYQNKWIIAALYWQLLKVMRSRKNADEIEMGWVGDYNKKMQSLYNTIGAIHNKTHITYLKLFDSSIVFERFTNSFEGKMYEYKKKSE